jgi:hypothetical protein
VPRGRWQPDSPAHRAAVSGGGHGSPLLPGESPAQGVEAFGQAVNLLVELPQLFVQRGDLVA